jgi:hypothetical protein
MLGPNCSRDIPLPMPRSVRDRQSQGAANHQGSASYCWGGRGERASLLEKLLTLWPSTVILFPTPRRDCQVHLTPDMMEGAYNLLLTMPPFRGWKLPPAEEIVFYVTGAKDRRGSYHQDKAGRHVISMSWRCVKHYDTLIRTMAHELCHLEEIKHCARFDIEHSAVFEKLADRVCKVHPFDRGIF